MIPAEPIGAILHCPYCHLRHVDEGEWRTRPHHTHRCVAPGGCGKEWRVEPYCYGLELSPPTNHPDICPCGKPLHYSDPQLQAHVQSMVDSLGANTVVATPSGKWLIPRHYIALHGVRAAEVERLGFVRVSA